MMQRVLMYGLCMAMTGLMGCQHAPADRTLVRTADAYQLGFAAVWAGNLSVPASQDITAAVVLDDLLVTIETPSNMVTAVTVKDGHVRWRHVVGQGREQALAAFRRGDRLFINTENHVYQLDAHTGDLRNITDLEQTVSAGPAVYEDYGIFGGVNGLVFAHDLTSGLSKWSYLLTDQIRYRPVGFTNTVFVADRRGVLAMLNSGSGELLWRRTPADGVAGQPVVTSVAVIVPTTDHKLFALQRATSQDRWKNVYEQDLPRGPIVVETMLFQPLEDGSWLALEVGTGKELWRLSGKSFKEPWRSAEKYHSIVRTRQGLLFASANEFTLIEPATGRIIRQQATQPTQAVLPLPGGSLLVLSPTGGTMRLDPLE